jgi:hypothetical protein
MLLHSSGEWIMQEGIVLKMDKQTAQGAGSAITYGRRYMLSAMLGIASEDDDDGNIDAKNNTKQPEQKHRQTQPGIYTEISKEISTAIDISSLEAIKKYIIEKNKNKWLTAKEFQGLMSAVSIKLSEVKK